MLVSHFPESVRHLALARGVQYGVRSTLMLLVAATRAKFGPHLRSVSQIRYVGVCPYGVASRSRTRYPGIGRRSRHVHMDHLPRLEFDEEKGKKRTEEEIGHLQKITGPHPCRMITQECFPGLSTRSFSGNLFHLLLDGSFDFPEYPA